jgi:hydrogenase maturation protein HypF
VKTRRRIRIVGIVQGVGFRPFVARLAAELALSGSVRNTSSAVVIEVEGDATRVEEFLRRLETQAPPAATIEHLESEQLLTQGAAGFHIEASETTDDCSVGLPPDLAICRDCMREMDDPQDRRYRYAFLNCTLCGPRYTIVEGLPYDRDKTAMKRFPLCAACQAEYENPADRRYHAQPIACPQCGPRLENFEAAIAALKNGEVVAVRGVGGFHLACDARNAQAVAQLRRQKARGNQPFALMLRDLATVAEFVHLDAQAEKLLQSPAAPIVLLPKRQPESSIAPGNGYLGVMLPYSPLHRLLFQEFDALVMTSANRHGEPIVTEDASEFARVCITHNRPIVAACDDSVVRLYRGRALAIRRARGYAPLTLKLPIASEPALAVGAELKAALCLAEGQRAYVSPHLGDMENLETIQAFEKTLAHLSALYRIAPQVVIHDAHTGYLSTDWAQRCGLPCVAVQHHKAHVAAVLAEYGILPDVNVVAAVFDGTGYGEDGAIWGGEFFAGALCELERVAHLPYVALPGGDASARRPALAAFAHLKAAGLDWVDGPLTPAEMAVLRKGIHTYQSSSMGRLFDAASSLLGIRHRIDYEAQAAIELEALACGEPIAYEAAPWDLRGLWLALTGDPSSVGERSMRFHATISRWTCETLLRVCSERCTAIVVLCGGVFQNVLLLEMVSAHLEQQGLQVLVPRYLPPNDGGLALGQIYLAASASLSRKGRPFSIQPGLGASLR